MGDRGQVRTRAGEGLATRALGRMGHGVVLPLERVRGQDQGSLAGQRRAYGALPAHLTEGQESERTR